MKQNDTTVQRDTDVSNETLSAAEESADEAIARLVSLVESEPRNSSAHNDLGVLYYNLGKIEHARSCFQAAVDCDNRHQVAQKNLADVLIQLGEVDAALRVFQGILGQDPNDVYSLVSAGGLLFLAKRFDSAAYYIHHALEIEPANEGAKKVFDLLEQAAPKTDHKESVQPQSKKAALSAAPSESNNHTNRKDCDHNLHADVVALKGFDPDGEVFLNDGKVYRGVFSGRGPKAKELFEVCRRENLFENGVVETAIVNAVQFKHMKYDLIFEHAKVPFISYAHEWTPSMMKDAALFQIDLNLRLINAGLVLKDCGVTTNVLFDGANPVFVDFLSMVQSRALLEEEWLRPEQGSDGTSSRFDQSSQFFYSIFNRIFNPCVLFPLYMLHQNKETVARKRLLETALNTTNETITERETFPIAGSSVYANFQKYRAAKEHALGAADWKQFLRIQKMEIEELNVAQTQSGYSDYYQLKGEDFEFVPSANWKMKQKGVYSALKALKPATVLDLGANTGWFSILAATQGAQVVSLDNDVACMDLLYRRAKEKNLPILPLIVDFLNPTPDIAALDALQNDPHMLRSQLQGETPLLLSADKRIACDMVMALALIHHLCLGAGKHIDHVVKQLALFSHDHLVLEFVTKDDPLIVGEPTFFPSYNKNRSGFDWYTLENCETVLENYFATIDKVELTPSRILIVCTDKIKTENVARGVEPKPQGNKPKILFTTPVIEHPPAGGPALRIENSIKALGQISELHVAARIGQEELGGSVAEKFYAQHSHVFAYTPCLTASRSNADESRNAEAIVQYANEHGIEIIWCGYGNVSHHFMKAIKQLAPELKVVCDTDSVWSRFVLRELPLETNPDRRKQIESEGKQKEKEEAEWVSFCDVTTAVSEVDAEYYQQYSDDPSRVRAFSNVIDLDTYVQTPAPAPEMRSPSIYLAGSFYAETSPMARAARWVISEVLPKVQSVIPEVTLYCIGAGADRMLADIKRQNVVIKGKVPSVLPYLCHADVALVPLMFESGTRFKILEAAACNVPIVSTTLGAEGIPVRHGKEILIADDASGFAKAIISILKDEQLGKSLAAHCKKLVEEKFSVQSLVIEARSILDKLGVSISQ
jgi:polysaccharide biosynthesis protein PslH